MTVRVQFNLRPYVEELEKVAKVAVPHAIRNGLNSLAFEGRKLWQQEMRERFILRNDWVTKGVRVVTARGINLRKMQARVMSPDGFLVKQEVGGIEPRAVPTGQAAGQRGANPRTKLVRRPYKVGAIQLGDRLKAGTRAQRNAAAVRMAAAKGQKFVYLELPRRKGLFLVTGSKRPKVHMLWDTTDKGHRVPPHPTLSPAIRALHGVAPRLMKAAVVEQLKRAKVFGYR